MPANYRIEPDDRGRTWRSLPDPAMPRALLRLLTLCTALLSPARLAALQSPAPAAWILTSACGAANRGFLLRDGKTHRVLGEFEGSIAAVPIEGAGLQQTVDELELLDLSPPTT
jgi:hypothetical protein